MHSLLIGTYKVMEGPVVVSHPLIQQNTVCSHLLITEERRVLTLAMGAAGQGRL